MTDRENDFLDFLCDVGTMVNREAFKQGVDTENVNSIEFSVETGYVRVSLIKDGRRLTATRFNYLPDEHKEEQCRILDGSALSVKNVANR